MRLFEATFEIEPVPWQRVSLFKGRMIQSKETRQFEKDLGLLAKYKMGCLKPFDQPIMVFLIFYLKQPHRFRKRVYSDVAFDSDNLAKAALDACNGIIWKDDCRITDLRSSKRWAPGNGYILMEVFSAP